MECRTRKEKITRRNYTFEVQRRGDSSIDIEEGEEIDTVELKPVRRFRETAIFVRSFQGSTIEEDSERRTAPPMADDSLFFDILMGKMVDGL